MTNFVHDEKLGDIVDFDGEIRPAMRQTYDLLLPEFHLLEAIELGLEIFDCEPSNMVSCGASMLSWLMMVAADEHELAEELKDNIFTLGWTEEHAGSDLLSLNTAATKLNDDPDDKMYHIKGDKWLINNSGHADYHMVVAKVNPDQDGPRSLSLFLVPKSSAKNWERMETHILRNMVLGKFDIDGPGRLIGKEGHGLQILQRMAMPSKYTCGYQGIIMVDQAVRATIDHLSTKTIFKEQPVNFNNVFRQLYNLASQAAYQYFVFYRAVVFSDSSFLAFHGTMLKSFLLLRANETMTQNLLVAGSKGFLKESLIGRNAFDSFVLPVFDGHYTINTLMTAKHMDRYLNATDTINAQERIQYLRDMLFVRQAVDHLNRSPREIRRPDFFDYANYWGQLDVPVEIDVEAMLQSVRDLLATLNERGWDSDVEYKYKIGTLVHWLESVLAAAEMWKVFENDNYLNVIVYQYNSLVKAFNDIVAEGAIDIAFMSPTRQMPLPEIDDNTAFLRGLMNLREQLAQIRQRQSVASD
ncbi:MAG: acyl-CoA dehydrogenase family protein [Chloroflexota bacterium]